MVYKVDTHFYRWHFKNVFIIFYIINNDFFLNITLIVLYVE